MSGIKRRGYRHLDFHPRRELVAKIGADPKWVAAHPFLPLLHRTSLKRKFDKKTRKFIAKKRELYFCSHVDAAILEIYGRRASVAYEQRLLGEKFASNVLAYRRLHRSVASFAREVFEIVREMRECEVIALDIEHFFDNLDHQILKSALCDILAVTKLPPDWYAIFRYLTKYSFVEEAELKGLPGEPPTETGVPYCSIRELKCKHAIPIKRHRGDFGIPQGTPVSALLSNIYMYTFDSEMHRVVAEVGGIYRRYSDDIILIVPTGRGEECKGAVITALANRKLVINESKKLISNVTRDCSGVTCSTPISYLGFIFDGKVVRLRGSTIARHLKKMHRFVHVQAKKFCEEGNRLGRIPKYLLYERFSHLGHRRRRKSGKSVFGNFYSYALTAHNEFGDTSGIRKQVARLWPHLHNVLDKELELQSRRTARRKCAGL